MYSPAESIVGKSPTVMLVFSTAGAGLWPPLEHPVISVAVAASATDVTTYDTRMLQNVIVLSSDTHIQIDDHRNAQYRGALWPASACLGRACSLVGDVTIE
jgi:hypothetical protein